MAGKIRARSRRKPTAWHYPLHIEKSGTGGIVGLKTIRHSYRRIYGGVAKQRSVRTAITFGGGKGEGKVSGWERVVTTGQKLIKFYNLLLNNEKEKMKKLSSILFISTLLSACTMSDTEERSLYAQRYSQSDEYVAQFSKEIEGLSVEQLAINGAKKDKAKMNGKKRMSLGKYLYIEDVKAKQHQVIYEYSFERMWWNNLNNVERTTIQNNMQKDLIYRTCSLRTVALSQEKGLEESHQYYYDYPNKLLAFELKTNKQICLENGFKR